jgi:CubicO group peptidase (beta-lactamase class C family)
MARFGEAMRLGGRWNGAQVIPEAVIASVRGGGDPAHFPRDRYPHLPGWSYRSQWWITHNRHGAFMARGIHGQCIYIDPTAEMTIARFASHPDAAGAAHDPASLPAWSALARHLMENP